MGIRQHLSIAALSFVLIISAGSTAAQTNQPPASASTGTTPYSSLLALNGQYESGSDLVKPGIASQIRRAVARLGNDENAKAVVAQSRIILSRQAAIEGRKDFALREARSATALAQSITTAQGRGLRANSAVAVAQALLLKEEYLQAATTINQARRDYGQPSTEVDATWDQLALWQTIVRASAPARLEDQVSSIGPAVSDDVALAGAPAEGCYGIRLKKVSGDEPIYPVLSWLGSKMGGVALRSNISAQGFTTSTVVTAHAPNQGFAIAAQNAAATWRYDVPAAIPEKCHTSYLTLFAFAIR